MEWGGPRYYEAELTPENLVSLCIENGILPNVSKMLSFEIKEGVGYLDMNVDTYMASGDGFDWIQKPTLEKTFLENYKSLIENVVITYDGQTPKYNPY